METTQAVQGDNFLPNQIPTDGTNTRPSHTAWGKAALRERDGCVDGPVNQITPPPQSKRRILTRMQYIGLPPNRWRPLSIVTLARSSLRVYSNQTSPLLRCCVSAFQLFVAMGTRTERDKLSVFQSQTCMSRTGVLLVLAHSLPFL